MADLTTILLVPPDGDATLLADSVGGGRMPIWFFGEVPGKSRPCPVCGAPVEWFRPPTDQMDPCFICSTNWRHKFAQADVTVCGWQRQGLGAPNNAPRALLLVLNGTPVPEGCDRAARAISARTVAAPIPKTIRAFSPLGTYALESKGLGHPYGVLDLCRAWEAEGARVVIVGADGCEASRA